MYTSETLTQFGITDESVVILDQAHPDDEAVAFGGLLAALNQAGVETHLAHNTVGEASTVGDPALVMGGHRADELTAFGKAVGVPPENMHQFNLQDGGLDRLPQRLAHMYRLTRLIGKTSASHLFVPGLQFYEDEPHEDHWAVWKDDRMLGNILRFAGRPLDVWSNADAWQDPAAEVPVDAAAKMDLLRHHATQFNQDPTAEERTEIFGRPVARETAQRLRQYAPFFRSERYVPLVGQPKPVVARVAATVLAAVR